MGGGFYSSSDRATRAMATGYGTKSVNDIFVQQNKQTIIDDMNPKNVAYREARDSEDHPNTVPLQLYLDVTGSMGKIPHMFIKDGLPKMVSTIVEAGIPDIAVMFGAVGDHNYDSYPLQVAQFESSDEKLDHWLTHTYIESGGGGNCGESYALAWYFAGNHVITDAWEKRKRKGYVFTIGDEPILLYYSKQAIKNLMGNTCNVQEENVTNVDLLDKAREFNHVFHIHVDHSYNSNNTVESLKNLLGQSLIIVKDYKEIPNIIAKIIVDIEKEYSVVSDTKTEDKEIIL